MNNSEKLYNILATDESLYVALWNSENGWIEINAEGCPSLSPSLLADGNINGLLDLVYEEDIEICRGFLRSMKRPPKVSNPVKHRRVIIRLLSVNDEYVYYNIESDSVWKQEVTEAEYILLKIRESTAAEVYQMQLAQKKMNVKKPNWFADSAKKCYEAYPDGKFAIIQFDVVKFKLINEQYGEKFGDELLDYIIKTLDRICNETQFAMRLSADVFMIFTKYETEQDIHDFIQAIAVRLDEYKGARFRLVFGVSYITDKSKEMRYYGDNAALARQNIKNDSITNIAFYKEELKQNARTRKFVEDEMEQALIAGEFVMFLQPKYSISQNKIIGAEALVRWIHNERGMIPPMDFIPIFEQNGFILKMDVYIWKQACKTIRRWIDAGYEPIPISVNMSRKHLQNKEFIQTLNDLTAKYQIERKYLEIEITETASEEDMINGIQMLKENGYTLLMDDFGSGYSSLNTLKDSKFDVLKIDRGFLQDFIISKRGKKIVEHVVKMTKAIGMDLIAEGVENKDQAVFLAECGCDKVQGFYYGRPMSLDDFESQGF